MLTLRGGPGVLKTRSSRLGVLSVVAAMLAGTTWLLYYAGAIIPSYVHLFYVPIVIAGFFLGDLFGLGVGLGAAALSLIANKYWNVPPPTAGTDIYLDMFIRTVFFFAIGLLTARLSAILGQRGEEAGALLSASHMVNQSLRLEEILPDIARSAAEISDGKASLIRLLGDDGEELVAAASYGLSDGYLGKGPVRVAESSMDEDVMAGKVVTISDIRRDSRIRYRESAVMEGLVGCICVPIQRGGRALGILRVFSEVPRFWSKSDQRLLSALAAEAAVAIENARLHESLRRSYWETVRALTRAIEAKDPLVLGHSERVTDYSLQIGQRLQLPADQMETLRFAAALHDIGKIAVEEQLMRHSNPRAYREALESNHPLVGMSILQPAEFLRPALDGVRSHHEHYDGSGYPLGLQGEEIPLLARIIAVANTYDNLLNPSWGEPTYTPDEALGELRQRAGGTLDPHLVELFASSMAEQD